MDNFTVVTDLVIDDLISLYLLSALERQSDKLPRNMLRGIPTDKSFGFAQDGELAEPLVHSFSSSSRQAARYSQSLNNQIISTFGNIPETRAFLNAQEFLSTKNSNWKLIHGEKQPPGGKFEHQWLSDFNGPDGFWGIHPKINPKRVHLTDSLPPNHHLISIAAMTEVLRLLQAYKETVTKVTIMGGVFKDKGNFTQYSECNIAYDPDSAHQFFSRCQDYDVEVIPLDVTRKVFWDEKTVDSIPVNSIGNQWLKKILKAWYQHYGRPNNRILKLHDPLAVYLTFFPAHAQWKTVGVEVILDGAKRGQTVFNKHNPSCKIALGLSNPENISQDIFNKVFYQS